MKNSPRDPETLTADEVVNAISEVLEVVPADVRELATCALFVAAVQECGHDLGRALNLVSRMWCGKEVYRG